MANKELVYLSDVRRTILRFEPEAVYTLEGLRRVDAVEVVRFKDCIFKRPPKLFGELECRILGIPMRDDDFCSYGERRTDG